MQDWTHQDRAIRGLRERFGGGLKRGILVLPTGGGKTRTSLEMIRLTLQRGKRALFVADRRVLVYQAAKAARALGVPCGIVMNDAGTDADSRDWNDPSAPLQIVSKDTLSSWLAGRSRFDPPPAELIVTDECHRSGGLSWDWVPNRYPNAFEVGLSATPCKADGTGLGFRYEFLVQPTSYSQLIANGVLVEPVCYAPASAGKMGQAGKPSGKSLVGNAVTWWQTYANGLRTFAFCSDVAHSLYVRDEFRKAGIRAEHIDGNTPDTERDNTLKRLASGETLVVTNCNVLRYGVDVPNVECAQILAPMGSLIDYLQSCGRVLRSAPGKQSAIIIDHAGAVLYHGFPHTDVLWELDEGTDHTEKRKQPGRPDEEPPTPIGCPKCNMLFSKLPACPGCGWKPERKGKEKSQKDGVLQRVSEAVASYSSEDLNRIWRATLGMSAARGFTLSKAAHIFKGKAGRFPWQCSVSPMPGDGLKWNRLVKDVFPNYLSRKREAEVVGDE